MSKVRFRREAEGCYSAQMNLPHGRGGKLWVARQAGSWNWALYAVSPDGDSVCLGYNAEPLADLDGVEMSVLDWLAEWGRFVRDMVSDLSETFRWFKGSNAMGAP